MKRAWLLGIGLMVGCGGLKNAESGGTDMSSSSGSTTEAVSGVEATDSQSALAITVTEGATFTATSTDSATAASTATTAAFTPSGCATQTTQGAKVTYSFADCSGPYGLVHVQGSLTVTYAATPASVGVTLSSSGLKVASTTLDLAGSATYTSSGGNKLVLTPSGSATDSAGDTISWSGAITTGWTSTCVTLDGSYTFMVDSKSWSVAATDYQRCEAACPAAGGSLALTGSSGDISISYDGSSSATYTTSSGSGKVPLLCGT